MFKVCLKSCHFPQFSKHICRRKHQNVCHKSFFQISKEVFLAMQERKTKCVTYDIDTSFTHKFKKRQTKINYNPPDKCSNKIKLYKNKNIVKIK